MTPEFLNQRKEDLLREKEEIEKELSSFANKTSENNWETNFPHNMNNSNEDEDTDEVEEYENLLPVERSLEERLMNINIALEKIEKGSYGKCDKCGKEISEERLTAIPEAKNCIECN
ncbi:MAG: TraR/DksA family transcriptional regulator [Candidatus Pacebacteria bacterium]|nr:TraR/DksA family transcriptional regulator [Candidatus Paceibacterota bacterium]MDD4074400.1 TraR/DksA family transcriptional regulator [Candidatus Paceibacterota bacterium]